MELQEIIDIRYEQIEGLQQKLSEDHYMTPDQEEELEQLITQAIKFGELCAQRDAKSQAVPEGFVLVPKELSDEKADIQASLAWSCHLGLFKSQNRDMSTTEIEEFRLKWCGNKARDLQEEYKAMIKAQEQSHD
jgi:hypothetical protein